jgi:hypothetical protein
MATTGTVALCGPHATVYVEGVTAAPWRISGGEVLEWIVARADTQRLQGAIDRCCPEAGCTCDGINYEDEIMCADEYEHSGYRIIVSAEAFRATGEAVPAE